MHVVSVDSPGYHQIIQNINVLLINRKENPFEILTWTQLATENHQYSFQKL